MPRFARASAITLAAAAILCGAGPARPAEQPPAGLTHRLIVGYQGWFGCPGDFDSNPGWQHWFADRARPEALTVDLLPSVRELKPEDLCDTGMPRRDGHGTVRLYSAQNPSVVARHFAWMRDHGIDGAAAQRFIQPVAADPRKKGRSDQVLRNVRAAAEASGRVFFVVYDVSGASSATVTADIRADWRHLVGELRLTESPAYLRDGGKPVLELWGFGFGDHPGAPPSVAGLITDLKSGADGLASATVIGGVPSHWRTLDGDSQSAAEWAAVYRSYDVISPWTVGRFADDSGADQFVQSRVTADLAETRRLGLRYLPVVFPGFSWSNLMRNRGRSAEAIVNRIPRRCGQFLWRQVTDLLPLHVDALYVAMFDEADEGTAIFPAVTRTDGLPVGADMLYLDEDGCSLPDDWYLRVAGAAARFLHASAVPPGQLDLVIRP
jgi:hypothetical protein